MSTSLDSIISTRHARLLRKHWITTSEELIAISMVDEVKIRKNVLRVSKKEYKKIINKAYEFSSVRAVQTPNVFPLGISGKALSKSIISIKKNPYYKFKRTVADLPSKVNLIYTMPDIKTQGERGTCVAFGSLSVRDYLTNPRDKNIQTDLSEQHLYFLCKECDGSPDEEGTWPHVAFEILYDTGVSTEETWSYNPHKIPGNVGQGPPPPEAEIEAKKFKISKILRYDAKDIYGIKSILAGDSGGVSSRPVEFGIYIFENIWNEATERTGKILMPIPGESIIGGHSMCFVGYEDDIEAPGGGYFILKNSWGEKWASESKYSPGYGIIPYQYIIEYGMEIYSAIVKGERSSDDNFAQISHPIIKFQRMKIQHKKRARKLFNKISWLIDKTIFLGTIIGIWFLFKKEIWDIFQYCLKLINDLV